MAEFAFDPLHPQLYTALTCLFLHDPENVLHMLGNLVFLAAVGPLVEVEAGPLRFVVVYIVAGLAGVAAHWTAAVYSGVGTPLIGASSAIAGCVGYCCLRYARRSVPIAPKLRLNVGVVAVAWVALQAFGAFVKFGDGGGTSYIAHLGGFVAGLLLAFVFKAQVMATTEVAREKLSVSTDRSPAAALAAAEEILSRNANDDVALWEKAAALHALGDRDHEAELLVTLVRNKVDAERAVDCLSVIGRLGQLTPSERMKLTGQLPEALRYKVLASVVEEADTEPERPHALLALAEISDDEQCERILRELSEKYALHPATDLARAKGLLS